jgi:hypothetical protein
MRNQLATFAAAVALAACAADPTSPPAQTTGDESTPLVTAGAAQQGDTTGITITYASRVRVSGRVLTLAAGVGAFDTLGASTPRAGARVTLYRNVLVDGHGVSLRVGEQTTGADGAFSFANVVGGPYVLALNVTPERFYGEAVTYALGTTSEVYVDLRVGTPTTPSGGGGAPTDSTRTGG